MIDIEAKRLLHGRLTDDPDIRLSPDVGPRRLDFCHGVIELPPIL